MKLKKYIKVEFMDSQKNKAYITITLKQLVELDEEGIYELLDNSESCTNSGCNNESQNFCDCGSSFEDYEISEIHF